MQKEIKYVLLATITVKSEFFDGIAAGKKVLEFRSFIPRKYIIARELDLCDNLLLLIKRKKKKTERRKESALPLTLIAYLIQSSRSRRGTCC